MASASASCTWHASTTRYRRCTSSLDGEELDFGSGCAEGEGWREGLSTLPSVWLEDESLVNVPSSCPLLGVGSSGDGGLGGCAAAAWTLTLTREAGLCRESWAAGGCRAALAERRCAGVVSTSARGCAASPNATAGPAAAGRTTCPRGCGCTCGKGACRHCSPLGLRFELATQTHAVSREFQCEVLIIMHSTTGATGRRCPCSDAHAEHGRRAAPVPWQRSHREPFQLGSRRAVDMRHVPAHATVA